MIWFPCVHLQYFDKNIQVIYTARPLTGAQWGDWPVVTHMCAADAFKQQPGDLSLAIELRLGYAKLVFCLENKTRGRKEADNTSHALNLESASCW